MRFGIERILNAAASPVSASVSTLPNTMSGCFPATLSYTGAKARHGPHLEEGNVERENASRKSFWISRGRRRADGFGSDATDRFGGAAGTIMSSPARLQRCVSNAERSLRQARRARAWP